jgi:hypothetical protein
MQQRQPASGLFLKIAHKLREEKKNNNKWHEKSCKLNKSYVHQVCVYKVTTK